MRDRLIELFKKIEKEPAITCPAYKTDKTCKDCKYSINDSLCNHIERQVDYLLANGVVVPPCEVGDTVYFLHYGEILTATVISIETNYYTDPNLWLTIEYYSKSIGRNSYKSRIDLMLNKTVFLTKEEAERALKGAKE